MKNVFIYFEILIKNKVSRASLVCLAIGVLFIVIGNVFFAGLFFTLWFVSFYFTNFGMNSYATYKRCLEHFVNYQRDVNVEATPCAQTGYLVAMKYFRKDYPEEYMMMLENKRSKAFLILLMGFHTDLD